MVHTVGILEKAVVLDISASPFMVQKVEIQKWYNRELEFTGSTDNSQSLRGRCGHLMQLKQRKILEQSFHTVSERMYTKDETLPLHVYRNSAERKASIKKGTSVVYKL